MSEEDPLDHEDPENSYPVEWAERASTFNKALSSLVEQASSIRVHPLYQGYVERKRKEKEAIPPPPTPEVANLIAQMAGHDEW